MNILTARLFEHALLFALATGVAGRAADPLPPPPPPPIPEEVLRPLLSGDWSSVARAGSAAQLRKTSPVARLLEGHACLALNRNNEAFDLFLSADSEADLAMWRRWTEDLERREPENVVALYLFGDAHARKQEWQPALDAFARALAIEPAHPLILNARGVVHALRTEWDQALLDLSAALRARADFADAHASLGALWIQKSTGARGARGAFTKALEITPCFALALYGRSAVEAVLGHWEEARKDLRQLAQCLPDNAQLLVAQVEQGLDRILGSLKSARDIADGEDAGMQMDRYVQGFQKGDWGFFGANLTKATELAYRHPELRTALQQGVQTALNSHPEQRLSITAKFQRIENAWAAKADWMQGLSRSVSYTGKITGELKIPGVAKVGGELGMTRTVERSLTASAQNFGGMRDFVRKFQETALPKTNPSGFKTGLQEAAWDEGDWPFTAQYGLRYVANRDLAKEKSGGERARVAGIEGSAATDPARVDARSAEEKKSGGSK